MAGPARPQLHRRSAAALTDADGRYRFTTIKPGAYPWGNHPNAWRPAHIHFSVFGQAFTQRLVTQMYFPDDPLFAHDPIFNSIPDGGPGSGWSPPTTTTSPSREWALGFAFDIVLRGRERDAVRGPRRTMRERLRSRPSQTVGPFLAIALPWPDGADVVRQGTAGRASGIAAVLPDGAGEPVPDGLVETWQADADGRFDHPDDPRGAVARRLPRLRPVPPPTPTARWAIRTVKPGAVPAATAAPRRRTSTCRCSPAACSNRLVTRIYFPDEADANAADPVLAALPAERPAAADRGRRGRRQPSLRHPDSRARTRRRSSPSDTLNR